MLWPISHGMSWRQPSERHVIPHWPSVVEASTSNRMLAVLAMLMPVEVLFMLHSVCCGRNRHTHALAYLVAH